MLAAKVESVDDLSPIFDHLVVDVQVCAETVAALGAINEIDESVKADIAVHVAAIITVGDTCCTI